MKKYLVAITMIFIFIGCGGTSDVEKTSLAVNITTDKIKVVEGQSVVFKSNVTGQGSLVTYEWSENGNTLGSESNLTKSNFLLGEHNISLKVESSSSVATAKKSITVSDYLVNINRTKTNYSTSENIKLEANVLGLVTVDTYTWREGNVTLGTTSKLDRKFSVGEHTVILEVGANNHIQTATFKFKIAGLSNFVTKKLGARKDEVMVDTAYNLMWVSDKDESKKACLAVHEANLTLAQTISQNFCQNIEFGEFPKGSWRAPTPDELSNFIKQTVVADILPAYYQECNLLFSDKNGTSKVVATRYGVINQIEVRQGEAGSSANAKLGEALEFRTHFGIRCVRDIY